MTDRPLCQNASRRGRSTRIVTPQCLSNRQEFAVRINYDPTGIDTDIVWVCGECKDRVLEEARSHDYDVEMWALD